MILVVRLTCNAIFSQKCRWWLFTFTLLILFNISGKALTELSNKGQILSSLPTSKSASLITNIPSQKLIDNTQDQQHAPSTLITSTSVSSNTGTTVVTNEFVATKKVVQTKTISPPVLIQLKQKPASSSRANQEFTKTHFIAPSASSDLLNKNNENLSKPITTNLVAVKSESLAGQDHRLLQNRNDSTNTVNLNGSILKKEGRWNIRFFL